MSVIPERRENVVVHIDVEPFLAHRIYGLADVVRVDAAFPAITRIEWYL